MLLCLIATFISQSINQVISITIIKTVKDLKQLLVTVIPLALNV
jgi:hypothetical protein